MIKFTKPTTNRDIKQLTIDALAVVKAAVTQDYLGSAVALNDLYENEKQKERLDIGAVAWIWVQELLTNTFLILANEQRLRSDLSEAEIEKVTKELLDDILTAAPFGELREVELLNPELNPIVDEALSRVQRFVDSITMESGLNETQLRTAALRALANASAKAIQSSPEFYGQLQTALTSPMSDAAKREFAWQRHNSYIQGLFHRTPIFSLNTNEQMPLSHIYIQPRGYWHEEITTFNEEIGEEHHEQVTFVRDLTDTLAQWASLSDVARDEKLKVIMGGPGSGKSSFARSFASKLVSEGNSRVVYINLQHMKLRGDLQGSIENHLRDMHSWADLASDQGLPESPFNWAKTDNTPMFFFFDGLDELTARDDEAQTIAQAFLQDLQGVISKYEGQINIRAVVLGRNAACQEAARQIRLKRSNLLHVAPLTPIEDSIQPRHLNQLTSQFKGRIDGEESLLKTDQRLEFWNRWVSLKGGKNETPKIFGEEALAELTSEPLFLLLIILAGFVEGAWEEAAKNKNIVYKDILEKIYDRNQAKDHQASTGIDKNDFYKLMETIGLATWHGNGRTGTEEDFVKLRVLYVGADEDERLDALPGSKLKNVALQIHAQEGQDTRSGFEFIHKSFGEYLSAKAILIFANELANQDRLPLQDKAIFWAKMTAYSDLDTNLAGFLTNEVANLSDKSAQNLRAKLEKLARWLAKNGTPVHLLEGATTDSFRSHEKKDTNCSRMLSFLISELADRNPLMVADAKNYPEKSVTYLRKSEHGYREFLTSVVNGEAIGFPISMKWFDLRGFDLIHTCFPHCLLEHVDFSGASLHGSVFNFSSLRFSNFNSAQMSFASFLEVRLEGASLRNAYLKRSTLDDVSFDGVDVTNADFSMARSC